MRKVLLTSVAAGTLAFAGGAHAVTITSPATLNLINFGTAGSAGFVSTVIPASGGLTFTDTGATTGLYAGSGGTSPNGFTSPFGAGSLREYIAVQPGGTVTITFATPQTSFSLLWGTVDSYNGITFATSGGDTVTGTQVGTALGFPANGATTTNVTISGLSSSFTSLTVTDNTASAFEFDPASILAVPEPMSLALLGTGLVGVAMTRRRKASGIAA